MNIEKLIEKNKEVQGVVINLNKTPIVFILHHNELLDGIRFNDKDGQFKNLRDDQFASVNIKFTKKNYLVDAHFGRYDYDISLLSTYSIQGDGPKVSIMKVIKDGEFNGVVKSALNI